MEKEDEAIFQQAEEIRKGGRWKRVNNKITELVRNPKDANKWDLTVRAPLCTALFREYFALKEPYEKKEQDISYFAWRARNLLELSIWCIFCAKSDENASRFYDDSGRDGVQILKKFETWGKHTAQDAEWMNMLIGGQEGINDHVEKLGIKSTEGKYKSVTEAANECGFGEHFSLAYKNLSKFAHPTALQIFGNAEEEIENSFKSMMFSQGCLFFVGGFEVMEAALIVPLE